MIKHRNILTLILFLNTLFNICNAQTKKESLAIVSNWKEIIVMQLDSIGSIPKYFGSCGGGEFLLGAHKKLIGFAYLSKRQLKKVKKFVAKEGGRVVYIDIHNKIWTEEGIYFVWSNCLITENIQDAKDQNK
jgi:hypothetical protein